MATEGKAALRERLLAARRSVSDDVRAEQASALVDHVAGLMINGGTVCAYVPVGAEPGSVELLDALRGHADRVLLPVARTTADDDAVALQWGEYRPGQLVTARFGLLEPAGPWLPATTVAEAGVVLVPALAVDRSGRAAGPWPWLLRPHAGAAGSAGAADRRGPRRGAARRGATRGARRPDDPCADPGLGLVELAG